MPTRRVKGAERRRCPRACSNCKRRKERCDGRQPCGRCIERGVRTDCKHRGPTIVASSLPSPDYEQAEGGFLMEEPTGNGSGSATQGSQPRDAASQQPEPFPVPRLSRLVRGEQGTLFFIGDAANLSFLQSIRTITHKHLGSCSFVDDPLRYYMVEAHPNGDQRLSFESAKDPPPPLPTDRARYFVEWFQRATSCILELFDSNKIHEDIQKWRCHSERRLDAMGALCSLVVAIGAQTCPDNYDDLAERHFNFGRYITKALLMDDPSIMSIQCHILITMYLLSASRRNAAFMALGTAIRGAYALGVHKRDISALYDSYEYATRERLWRSIRILDLFMSASLGRPQATFETRDTSATDGYSASNDLCWIFENILIKVYAKRMVTAEDSERISELHRAWASRYIDGVETDGIYPDEPLTQDGSEFSSIGLLHLKEAYYWTIMLLSRPFLLEHVSSILQQRPSRVFSPAHSGLSTSVSPHYVLVQACIDSATQTAALFQPYLSSPLTPKRLPFVINSAFVAALVLGLASLGDLDDDAALTSSLDECYKVLLKFSQHDAVTKRYLILVDNLRSACKASAELRGRQRTDCKGQVGRLFGRLHRDDVNAEPSPGPVRNQGPREQSNSSIVQTSTSRIGSVEGVQSTAAFTGPCMESSIELTYSMPQTQGDCGNMPEVFPTLDGDMANLLSPGSLWLNGFDHSMLYPTTGTDSLVFANMSEYEGLL